jgi:hypothetical protein
VVSTSRALRQGEYLPQKTRTHANLIGFRRVEEKNASKMLKRVTATTGYSDNGLQRQFDRFHANAHRRISQADTDQRADHHVAQEMHAQNDARYGNARRQE